MTEHPVIPICVGCKKHPHQIHEYVEMAAEEGVTPTEFVMDQEGTYNPDNGHFYCTVCYIKADMPLGVAP